MKSSDFRREREQRRRTYYREGILHAAERVILRKGYSATTMDDVAREARLSKATIYKYIPGKGALLYEILSHYFDELRNKMEAIASGAGTAADKLRQAMRLALTESESKRSLTRVLWMDKSMLKLMRVFVAASGKPASATAADRKMIGLLRDKRQEITASRRPDPRGRRGRGRIPAHGHGPGRRIPRGRARRLHPRPFLAGRRAGLEGRRRRADAIRPRRHPEPRTNPEGELT